MSDQQFRPAHSAFDESPEVKEAAALSLAGKRLDRAAAEALYYGASLHTLAQLAHAMRLRLHPEPIVTYVGDRNINYSNVCVCACRFCAFFRAPESGEGYVITREEMAQMMTNYAKFSGSALPSGSPNFTDADSISDYAVEAVGALAAAGVLGGRDDGTFSPQDTATRAEASAVLHRFVTQVIK